MIHILTIHIDCGIKLKRIKSTIINMLQITFSNCKFSEISKMWFLTIIFRSTHHGNALQDTMMLRTYMFYDQLMKDSKHWYFLNQIYY